MPRWPEEVEGMETSKRARRRKLDTAKTDLKPPLAVLRRAGCPSSDHHKMESEGPAEKYRAAINGETQRWTGRPKVGQGRVCEMKTKAFSFTHRTKVIAGGTVQKNSTW